MRVMPQKADSVIYAIRCKDNGRMYIGATANLTSRINTHFRELMNREKRAVERDSNGRRIGGSTPEGSLWQRDFDKYGKESFEVYILEENVSKDVREEREDYWIRKYKSYEPEYGYNKRTERLAKVEIIKGLPPLPESEG